MRNKDIDIWNPFSQSQSTMIVLNYKKTQRAVMANNSTNISKIIPHFQPYLFTNKPDYLYVQILDYKCL